MSTPDEGPARTSPFESFGRKLEEQFSEVESELRKVIAYLNDEVVPRTASVQLARLAEHLEKNRR